MKAGYFNIHEYLERLHENATEGNLPSGQQDGIIIPDENKKSFSWLKKEYDKSKVEVKVEIKMGGSQFKPGYEMQTDLKSVKDFKPGMYGEIKTSDTPGSKKEVKDSAETQAEKEGKKPEVEKKAEKSTGGEQPKKSGIQAKVKTADDEAKPKKQGIPKKEEKEDDKT
jgi:hypothetical protein